MGLISRLKTWVDNEVLNYSDLNSEFDTIHTLVNGNIDENNVDTTAVATVGTSQTISGAKTLTGQTTFSERRVGTIYDNGNSGTSATIDWSNGESQKITLTGNCTFTFSNVTAGAYLTLWLVQDGTGSRTVTWPSGTKHQFGVAPTLSTGASEIDMVGIRAYDGSTYHIVGTSLDLS